MYHCHQLFLVVVCSPQMYSNRGVFLALILGTISFGLTISPFSAFTSLPGLNINTDRLTMVMMTSYQLMMIFKVQWEIESPNVLDSFLNLQKRKREERIIMFWSVQ